MDVGLVATGKAESKAAEVSASDGARNAGLLAAPKAAPLAPDNGAHTGQGMRHRRPWRGYTEDKAEVRKQKAE
jgi:hypothetical protein